MRRAIRIDVDIATGSACPKWQAHDRVTSYVIACHVAAKLAAIHRSVRIVQDGLIYARWIKGVRREFVPPVVVNQSLVTGPVTLPPAEMETAQ